MLLQRSLAFCFFHCFEIFFVNLAKKIHRAFSLATKKVILILTPSWQQQFSTSHQQIDLGLSRTNILKKDHYQHDNVLTLSHCSPLSHSISLPCAFIALKTLSLLLFKTHARTHAHAHSQALLSQSLVNYATTSRKKIV